MNNWTHFLFRDKNSCHMSYLTSFAFSHFSLNLLNPLCLAMPCRNASNTFGVVSQMMCYAYNPGLNEGWLVYTPLISSLNSFVASLLLDSTGTSILACWTTSKCLLKGKPSVGKNIAQGCQEFKYLSSWHKNYGINGLPVQSSKL